MENERASYALTQTDPWATAELTIDDGRSARTCDLSRSVMRDLEDYMAA